MKIKGKRICGANREIVPIPRGGDKEDIILEVVAVLDDEDFKKLCPTPKPTVKIIDGEEIPNLKDPNYIKQLERHADLRTAWLIITSLSATEGLEWEKVDLNDFKTWHLYQDELKEAGFSAVEIQRILNAITSVNGLDQDKIDEALRNFLLTREPEQKE